MAADALPSVAVAAAKAGNIVWEEAFGWADRERRIPATVHTPYAVASVTKPMTATAIMRLVEQGKLDLDRPINDYLGAVKLTGLAGEAEGATLRRVLNHTSGLSLHYHFFVAGSGTPVPPIDQSIARYGVLVHPPGEVYDYSNLGYGILGDVIERVTGESYAGYMRRAIFLPLDMTRSAIGIPAQLQDEVAVGYDSRQARVPSYQTDHPGASAAYSSIHDLIRFGMFHLKHGPASESPVLQPRSLDLMQSGARAKRGTFDPPSPRGLGWGLANASTPYETVRHFGSMHGVLAALAIFPQQDVAVAVLTNTEGDYMSVVGAIADRIATAVMPAYAPKNTSPDSQPFSASPPLLGEWQGTVRTWSGDVPLRLRVQPDNDIHVRLGNQLEGLLNDARLSDGMLTGRFTGTLPTADVQDHPHSMLLAVVLRDGKLTGQATALSPESLASGRDFALTSYVELKKTRR